MQDMFKMLKALRELSLVKATIDALLKMEVEFNEEKGHYVMKVNTTEGVTEVTSLVQLASVGTESSDAIQAMIDLESKFSERTEESTLVSLFGDIPDEHVKQKYEILLKYYMLSFGLKTSLSLNQKKALLLKTRDLLTGVHNNSNYSTEETQFLIQVSNVVLSVHSNEDVVKSIDLFYDIIDLCPENMYLEQLG